MTGTERRVVVICWWAHFGLSALMAALALRSSRWEAAWWAALAAFNLIRVCALGQQLRRAT